MLAVAEVDLVHAPAVALVLALVVGAQDGGAEPDDGAEPQGEVGEVPAGGSVLLVGGAGHVGAAVLELADGGGGEGGGGEEEGRHGSGFGWGLRAVVVVVVVVDWR